MRLPLQSAPSRYACSRGNTPESNAPSHRHARAPAVEDPRQRTVKIARVHGTRVVKRAKEKARGAALSHETWEYHTLRRPVQEINQNPSCLLRELHSRGVRVLRQYVLPAPGEKSSSHSRARLRRDSGRWDLPEPGRSSPGARLPDHLFNWWIPCTVLVSPP